jgi:adenosylmethionine-8-amino-7-oxononanoate aminotransferase
MGSLGEPYVSDDQIVSRRPQANGKLHKSAVLHRSLHHKPLHAITARGNYLYLSNGQKIFDATGGAAVACLGSGNQRYERTISNTSASRRELIHL